MTHDRTAPWWRDVTAQQWFVFAITSAAWLFDILDQRIFSVVGIPALSALMGLPGGDLQVQSAAKGATALMLIGTDVGGVAGAPWKPDSPCSTMGRVPNSASNDAMH